MGRFRVWDEGTTEDEWREVEAFDAAAAAAVYADEDTEGQTDGCYENGLDVFVRGDDGKVTQFSVSVEMEPVFYAVEVDRTAEEPSQRRSTAQANYAPTDFGTRDLLQQDLTGTQTITGFAAPGGADNEVVRVIRTPDCPAEPTEFVGDAIGRCERDAGDGPLWELAEKAEAEVAAWPASKLAAADRALVSPPPTPSPPTPSSPTPVRPTGDDGGGISTGPFEGHAEGCSRRSPVDELCDLVEGAGLTLTLHGKPARSETVTSFRCPKCHVYAPKGKCYCFRDNADQLPPGYRVCRWSAGPGVPSWHAIKDQVSVTRGDAKATEKEAVDACWEHHSTKCRNCGSPIGDGREPKDRSTNKERP